MFYNCGSLTSLNLSSFDTSLVTDMTSMFEQCSKLGYINMNDFSELDNLNTLNMFLGTPDDIIYCIGNENLTPSIKLQLHEKDCKNLDCEINWQQNYKNMIEEKKKDIKVIYDKCIVKDVDDINNDFYFSNSVPGVSIYSYDIESTEELKKANTNLTFIEFTQEQKRQLLRRFGVNENETLYVFISDSPSSDSRTATSEYNYVFVLGNGTMLDLSQLKEDFYVTVTVPIRDLDLAKFDFAKEYSDSGYDIYNKSGDFYNDVCSPATANDNDIILKDRKKDIYPNNVTLCQGNCQYNGIDLEDQRIICECNINADKVNETNDEEDFLEEEEESNFIDYILDNINYKIFKCYRLFNIDNLISNPAFYGVLAISLIVMIFTLSFMITGIPNLRIRMYKDLPTDLKLRKLIKEQKKKMKNINNKSTESAPPKNRKLKSKYQKADIISYSTQPSKNKKKEKIKAKKGNFINTEENLIETKFEKTNKEEEKQINDEKIEYNKFPYTRAVREDKRSPFVILLSVIIDKIDFFKLFICGNNFKSLMVCQFLLSLLLDFLFNTLFYSDEIVSHKYHNNGNLDFIITFALSIISNILSAIFMNFIESTQMLEERIDLIKEIKKEYKY